MKENKKIKKLSLLAICIALCTVLPLAFHMIPNGGNIFLPMHIPVLLCGLTCGWLAGLICGLIGPLLSSLLTGMPTFAYLPFMMVECATYGFTSALMSNVIKTNNKKFDLYLSLIIAMISGRIVSGIVKAVVYGSSYAFSSWVIASFVTAIPGIIIQLILVPSIIYLLRKSNIV